MTIKDNKALFRRIINKMNQRDFSIIPEVIAPDFIWHPPTGPDTQGLEVYMQAVQPLMTAFPDLHIRIDDIIGEGDQMAIRFTITGTFTGPYQGISPTNQKVTIEGLEIIRIVDGKFVEVWEKYDTLGFMQQLGVIPSK